MKHIFTILLLIVTGTVSAQTDLLSPFSDCHLKGSITLYDYQQQKWIFSDSADAVTATQPASTFKVINLLIALQTGVIKDENELVKWIGTTDTTLYGYRPDIYHDMTVKEAFEVSAVWVFIELAKKVGKERYKQWLDKCSYGNHDLSEKGADFWNFGNFAVSPRNQVEFLIRVYENKVPFSRRNIDILKRVMITENTTDYILRSKTGWTRINGNDIGWWIGYREKGKKVIFFATRLIKPHSEYNPAFGECRRSITRNVLAQLDK